MRHYGRKLLGWAVLLVLAMMVFPGIRPRVMLAYGTDNQKIVLFSSQEDVPKETLGLVVTSYDEPYDGKPHSIMVNTDELPAGTTIYYSMHDPSRLDFKESYWETCNPEFMCYTDPWTIYVKAENPDYETAYGSGTIRISQRDLTVTITGIKNQTPITYDGDEHSVNGYTISIPKGADLEEKDIFGPSQDSASATATRKDAGTTEMTLKATDFVAMTENYNVTFSVIPGSITIDPANVTVTITGNKNQTPITYDGDEHSVNGYTISIPEGANLTGKDIIGPSQDSASATATRKDAGTTEMTLKAIDFVAMTENYNVTFSVIPGSITIDPAESIAVYVTGNSDTQPYNGLERTVSGYVLTDADGEGIAEGISVYLKEGKEAKASGTDAREEKYMMGLTKDDFVASAVNYSEVDLVVTDGWILITKADRPSSPEVIGYNDFYDGKQHSITIDMSTVLDGDEFTYIYNDTESKTMPIVTDVADSINSIVVKVTNKNYVDVELDPVGLTIIPAKATITVTSASKTEGDADPVYTGTVEGLASEGDLGKIAYKRTNSDEAPGTYKGVITATYTANANYDVTVKNGDFTISERPKAEYKAVSGVGGEYTKGSDKSLTFVFKRLEDDASTFSHFRGIEVDGKAVPERDASGKANWKARSGSLILELQPSYLETLPVGEHLIKIIFDDGESSTTLKILVPEVTPAVVTPAVVTPAETTPEVVAPDTTPVTGDTANPLLWAAMILLAVAFAAVIVWRRREHA